MNLTEQLLRDGNLLKKEPRLPKPKKSLPKRSKKREIEDRIYAKKRKAFLGTHPYCEAGVSGGLIPPSPEIKCLRPPQDIHHIFGRGKHFLDEETWLAVCRPCHRWIHAHPKEAKALGLLQ